MWQFQDFAAPTPGAARDQSAGQCYTAHWNADGHDWVCHTAGGSNGISFGDPDGSLHVSLLPVGDDTLPVATEQSIRGDVWNVTLPQGDSQYSLRLALRVIEATETRLVIEPTLSIQTLLLDTHPTLDLTALGDCGAIFDEGDTLGDGSPPISTVKLHGETGSIAVLLAPTDAPFTTDLRREGHLQLRLFGEFLEKGVIRKARPWIVLDRSKQGISESELQAYLKRLGETPLPLTA
ncbi:hypothetical protein RISK_004504 [Rhodopirellula islandica]|uniref:Uncharacterized protein n=1 Tax=Rhodopirellula islandica TaxID=595434 RepID=A0A0J1B8Z2_RHOIS|nr:hypothetical protein [Rhodopirellula islandica]KLU03192.1 hypothetical protein RISK_004504 [Rhodopirellula islandica]